jgi:hypothetical protein
LVHEGLRELRALTEKPELLAQALLAKGAALFRGRLQALEEKLKLRRKHESPRLLAAARADVRRRPNALGELAPHRAQYTLDLGVAVEKIQLL